jgi:hypothetical protein
MVNCSHGVEKVVLAVQLERVCLIHFLWRHGLGEREHLQLLVRDFPLHEVEARL